MISVGPVIWLLLPASTIVLSVIRTRRATLEEEPTRMPLTGELVTLLPLTTTFERFPMVLSRMPPLLETDVYGALWFSIAMTLLLITNPSTSPGVEPS